MPMASSRQQNGFVVGTNLIFLCTCILCIAVITWATVGTKVVAEWGDLGTAVGSLDQSFTVSGMTVFHEEDPVHNENNPIVSWTGSSFADGSDFCDEGSSCGIHIDPDSCREGEYLVTCEEECFFIAPTPIGCCRIPEGFECLCGEQRVACINSA